MQTVDSRDDTPWRSQPVPAARPGHEFSAVELNDTDIVLFDNERLTYHNLNRPAYDVWLLCDGSRTAHDIASALTTAGKPLPIEAIDLAAAELADAGLLSFEAPANGRVDRRTMMKVAAAGVAGGVLLPVVSSITAPVSANLTTCTPGANLPRFAECACSSECDIGLCCCDANPLLSLDHCNTASSCNAVSGQTCMPT
jgi:hypothetical protein